VGGGAQPIICRFSLFAGNFGTLPPQKVRDKCTHMNNINQCLEKVSGKCLG